MLVLVRWNYIILPFFVNETCLHCNGIKLSYFSLVSNILHIGTIPVEVGMLNNAIGIGGDISAQYQDVVVVPYMNQVRSSSVSTMINWDASLLVSMPRNPKY